METIHQKVSKEAKDKFDAFNKKGGFKNQDDALDAFIKSARFDKED